MADNQISIHIYNDKNEEEIIYLIYSIIVFDNNEMNIFLLIAMYFTFVTFYLFLSKRHCGFVILLTFGFLYYILSPYVIFNLELFSNYPGVKIWSKTFRLAIPQYEIMIVFGVLILFSVYFFVNYINQISFPKFKEINLSSFVLCLYLFIIICFLLYIWFRARNQLFAGYLIDYDTPTIGQLATFNLLLNFMSFYTYLVEKRRVFYLSTAFLIINSLILLGMGGRMYVVTALITWVLYFGNRQTLKQKLKTLSLSFIFLIFFGYIGMWRLGISLNFENLNFITYIVFAEPLFTSFSSSSFLFSNDLPLIGNLSLYLESFIGILPSFFFPNKAEFFTSVDQLGYHYIAPLGAVSVIVYLILSFGILFTPIFILFLSLFFTFMKKQAINKKFWFAIYYTMLSIIPFLFFRSAFHLSTRTLVLPFIIFPLMMFLTDFFLKKKKHA